MKISTWLLAAAVAVPLMSPVHTLEAQDRFEGVTLSIDAGRQKIIAGALVEGVDVLAEDDRYVVGLGVGGRVQLDVGLVVGVELGVARFDGDLSTTGPGGVAVTWTGGDQRTLGGSLGWAFERERPVLAFAYLSEATRDFDASLAGPGGTGEQQDEQGFLRYGAGLEIHVTDGLGVEVTVGSGRADFGDAVTSIDPTRAIEFGVGLAWTF